LLGAPQSEEQTMKNPKKGQCVIVYDRYRFALPLRALVVGLSRANDGVQVQLMESNNPNYPVGCDNVWVSRRQLRKAPNDQAQFREERA